MRYSQNGYTSRDDSLMATYTISDNCKITLRKGDASVVLLHFLKWFDKNIEPLRQEDTGGYNPRAILGSDIDSNHASGTAADTNWQSHPRGKKNSFTQAKQRKIRAQLKFYGTALRWGGDYKVATIDDMHFEINAGPDELHRVALKCKSDNGESTEKTSNDPAEVFEDDGLPLAVDGNLGPKTIARWQKIMGTPVDGVISEKSTLVYKVQKRLRATVDPNLELDGDGNSLDLGVPRRTVEALQRYLKIRTTRRLSENNSDTVKALQRRLNEGRF